MRLKNASSGRNCSGSWGWPLAFQPRPRTKRKLTGPQRQKPGKLSHLFMFHKNTKKIRLTPTLATAAKSEVRRHTNGFPEADKKDAKYQPQTC